MKFALITTCCNRKKLPVDFNLSINEIPTGDQNSLLDNWVNRLQQAITKMPAIEMYGGRGFAEVRKIQSIKAKNLWVISAGLGLIRGDQQIPSYNLTISSSSNSSIQSRVNEVNSFRLNDWWRTLNYRLHGTSTPLNDLVTQSPEMTFVISISLPYVNFITEDINSLKKADLSRVRLIGISSPDLLPEKIRDQWMPYDQRFDGPDSQNPGTRSDFPQRATRHFIEKILNPKPSVSASVHAKMVLNYLEPMRNPSKVVRNSLPDYEIEKIIVNRWNEANGSSSRMLRILRDIEKKSCEQGRFANIFRQIKSRMT